MGASDSPPGQSARGPELWVLKAEPLTRSVTRGPVQAEQEALTRDPAWAPHTEALKTLTRAFSAVGKCCTRKSGEDVVRTEGWRDGGRR